MTTIPASQLVRVIPNVLSAGGAALVMNGLLLTQSPRVPIGEVLSFPNDGVSVANYFGLSSQEAALATTYFGGFNGSTKKPASILFAQYNSSAVPALLRGGPANKLTLAQLQGISGSLQVVVDGYPRSAAIVDLATATSFSAAAALIEQDLNANLSNVASVTGAIAAATAAFTGSIAGNVLTVTGMTSGTIVPGAVLAGTGVINGTQITSQINGTPGGIGDYAVSAAQAVNNVAFTATYGLLTVTAVASGTLSVGQVLSGTGVTAGTLITGLGTGEGLLGTYYVQKTQTVASGTITAAPAPVDVSFDSVGGGFVIASGITGAASSIAFATGTAAAPLYLTQATGANPSQGAAAAEPGPFMTRLTQVTQNWATFMTTFDPDGGNGNAQKLKFSTWTNGQDERWAYVAWDTDITPTESANAASSLGALVFGAKMDGTCLVWSPTDGPNKAAFVCGAAASIDFEATNGRITFAFRGQDGLVADVTDATVASNLIANGYNFYGAYATANQQFLMLQPGQISGRFEWLDSYVNQIWLNNALQLALVELLVNVNSVPYNVQGYELIKVACMDPVDAGLNFGAIRSGVTLSKAQAAEINNTVGQRVDELLSTQGWYLQVKDAAPQTRQARQTPPCNFFYMDGQSVQAIVLNSVLVQ
ncbi:DUF3383 domain-containing protein [Labrys sp. KB_33_2]|uniref:DUF3383 domain-containing protein n=1 Tax=Labrys sp. KB_33_2 TaxID=3237479 RepID=UPI003F8F4A35